MSFKSSSDLGSGLLVNLFLMKYLNLDARSLSIVRNPFTATIRHLDLNKVHIFPMR